MRRWLSVLACSILFLSQTQAMSAQEPPARPDVSMITDEIMVTYLTAAFKLSNAYWVGWFAEHEVDLSYVLAIFLTGDQVHKSGCVWPDKSPVVMTATTGNAIYCSREHYELDGKTYSDMITVPVTTLKEAVIGSIFDRGEVGNDVILFPFLIMSHEYTHFVVSELVEKTGATRPADPNYELIADCMAGAAAAQLRDYRPDEATPVSSATDDFSPGSTNFSRKDYGALMLALDLMGDGGESHGTSNQRLEAFRLGYSDTGTWIDQLADDPVDGVYQCFLRYWPEMAEVHLQNAQ
jgi:hypothetical protein